MVKMATKQEQTFSAGPINSYYKPRRCCSVRFLYPQVNTNGYTGKVLKKIMALSIQEHKCESWVIQNELKSHKVIQTINILCSLIFKPLNEPQQRTKKKQSKRETECAGSEQGGEKLNRSTKNKKGSNFPVIVFLLEISVSNRVIAR